MFSKILDNKKLQWLKKFPILINCLNVNKNFKSNFRRQEFVVSVSILRHSMKDKEIVRYVQQYNAIYKWNFERDKLELNKLFLLWH